MKSYIWIVLSMILYCLFPVEEAVPKTPQQEHKEKKVKTPLQFVKPTIEDKNLHTVTAPQVKSTVHKASSHSKTSKKKSTKNMEEIIENVELNGMVIFYHVQLKCG